MSEPVRVLVLDTVMDRGGAETMTMNYLRRMDRSNSKPCCTANKTHDLHANRPESVNKMNRDQNPND